MEVGVDAAAVQLGLTGHRVRELIRSGELPARRVAGRWLVETDRVARLSEDRSPGRPLSPRMAWGLIRLLDRGEAPELSPPERSRLRARLRQGPEISQIARVSRGRAEPHPLHVHPAALGRALSWDGAVATGASAGGHDVVDLAQVEIYLPAAALPVMARSLRAVPGKDDVNLLVRVPSLDAWPFPEGRAGPAAVALDLWEAGDSRSRRAAERLWRNSLAAQRFEPRR